MWTVRRTESKYPYVAAIVPEHPNADSRGRVYLHRIVVENRIGRLLTSDETVHHINGDKADNREENLAVMMRAEHTAHHMSTGRTMVTKACAYCGAHFTREARTVKGRLAFCSRRCGGIFYRRPQHGTYGRYRAGCHCAECRAANAAKAREQRKRRVRV